MGRSPRSPRTPWWSPDAHADARRPWTRPRSVGRRAVRVRNARRAVRAAEVRGPRVRRGDVRAAILDLLAEGEPWNGYQIIQEIGARTQGVWRPSAGSVYP